MSLEVNNCVEAAPEVELNITECEFEDNQSFQFKSGDQFVQVFKTIQTA